MEFIKKRKVSIVSAWLALAVACTVLLGWTFDVAPMKSLLPGLPPMIPLTAIMVGTISVALLLIATSVNQPHLLRSRVAAGLCVFSLLIVIQNIFWHLFGFSLGIELLFFKEKVMMASPLYQGKMSVQTSLATMFLASSLLIFRLPGNARGIYLFEGLLVATASLCLVGIVGYSHDPLMAGPTRFIGLSLGSIVSYFLLAVGTVFLKIDKGIVKSLGSRDSAGLFLRWYLSFSILFPLISSLLISYGENSGLYHNIVAKTAFVVVIIASFIVLGLFIAPAIRRFEEQRRAMEKAEARAALEESEESLKQTKERLEFALEASGMGTWENDLLSDRLELSVSGQRIAGLTEPTISGAEFRKLVHPEDVEYTFQNRIAALRDGTDLSVDFRMYVPDEKGVPRIRWIRCKGRLRYDRKGKPRYLMGTIQDITGEKNHQQQLEEALKEAESASSLKSTFLANMSHEIRTPLGAILGFADVLNDPTLNHEERTRYLQIIQRNGETLSHLLNDILDLSKVESGHLDVEHIRFPLKTLLGEVTALMEVRAKERGLDLNVYYGEGVPASVVSDPMRLKQILMNLVGNALKFTEVGGVKIEVSVEGTKLKFDIVDTGVGIDPEKQKKLFKPFSQADSSITRIFGGTGLGLVLSRRLAELLGGSIELTHSVVGEGSTFTLVVENYSHQDSPAKDVSAPGIATPDKRPLAGYQILLTEDSPDIQRLLTLILKKEGAAVDLAQNGADCLEKYQLKDYDLILMDIQMPIMDGYTAARQLRTRGYRKPVIALTAHAMSDESQRCLQAGCDGYLSKPVDRQKLVQQILQVAPR